MLAGARGPTSIRLLPAAGLWLDVQTAENPAKFIAAFRATWAALPKKVRRDLLSAWSAPTACQPVVVLAEELPELHDGYVTFGMYEMGANRFTFQAETVRQLREQHLRALIAHEIVHAHSDAVYGYLSLEMETDMKVRSWGFDIDGLAQAVGYGDARSRVRG